MRADHYGRLLRGLIIIVERKSHANITDIDAIAFGEFRVADLLVVDEHAVEGIQIGDGERSIPDCAGSPRVGVIPSDQRSSAR